MTEPKEPHADLKASREQWEFERWQCEQRLHLLNLLLGHTVPRKPDEQALKAVRQWMDEHGQSSGKLGDMVEHLLGELAAMRTAASEWMQRQASQEGERNRMQLELNKQERRIQADDQEIMKLKRWVTAPMELLGAELEERKGEMTKLQAQSAEGRTQWRQAEDDRLRWHERASFLEQQVDRFRRDRDDRERWHAEEVGRLSEEWHRQLTARLDRLAALESELARMTHREERDTASWMNEREGFEQRIATLTADLRRVDTEKGDLQRTLKEMTGREEAAIKKTSEEWAGRMAAQSELHADIVAGAISQAKHIVDTLREPLQKLLGEKKLREEFRGPLLALVQQIDEAGESCRRVVEGVPGRPAPVAPVMIGEVVQEVTSAIRVTHVTVQCVVLGEPVAITADQAEVRRVCEQVCANAVEAMADGGTLEVTVRYTPKMIRVGVRDTGIGMEPQILAQVGNPFFSTKSGHVGLGVGRVRGLVERLGGSVIMCSEPRKGTTVMVIFPFHS